MNEDTITKTIKALVADCDKRFGKGAVMSLGDESSEPTLATPTGSVALDLALGIGGFPRGRVVEVYGPEGGGKKTLLLHTIAACQKGGRVVAYIDADQTLDVAWAKTIGVKLEHLLISQPDTGEQALEIVEVLVRSGAVDLVVVSSIGALQPKLIVEGEYDGGGKDDLARGVQARNMSQALRKTTAFAHRTQTTVVFLNHLQQRRDGDYPVGDNALKFYASVRVEMRCIGTPDDGDDRFIRAKVVKNKCAPPFTEATLLLRPAVGFVVEGV